MAEYYEKLIDLQNKLRRSEEERLKLELKFSEIIQVTREEEQLHYRKLRHQYKIFLEEDRKRQERNEKILSALEKIDARISRLSSRSDVYQRPRRLCRSCQRACAISRYPCTDDIPRGDYEEKCQTNATKKMDIFDECLKSLKETPKSVTKQKQFERIGTTELDNLREGLNKKFDSNQANSIAAEIMNSIYSRHYQKDLSNTLVDPPLKENNTDVPFRGTLPETPVKNVYSVENTPSIENVANSEKQMPVIKNKEDESKITRELNCPTKETYFVDHGSENTPDPKKYKQISHSDIEKLEQELPTLNNLDDQKIPANSTPNVKLPPKTLVEEHFEVKDQQLSKKTMNIEQYEEPDENIKQYEPQYNGKMLEQQNLDEKSCVPQQSDDTGHGIEQQSVDEDKEHVEQYVQQVDKNGKVIQKSCEEPGEINGQIKQQQYEETGENVNQYEPQYDENGQIIEQQNYNETEHHYDVNGRIIQQQYEGTGENVNQYELQYDENGQIIGQQNYEETQHHYDENGQIIQQQYEETGNNVEQYEPQYDENGQIIGQQNYEETQHHYDENGQIIQQQYEETGNNIEQYEAQYDENGQIIGQQNYEETQPHYDENGQIIQQQYEETGNNVEQYEPQYDENGQIIGQQNYEETQHHYDENGQIIQQQYEETGENVKQYEPQYDENGKIVEQYEPQHHYDENGQIIQQQYEETGETLKQYEPQYDENGQLIQQQNFAENTEHIDQYQYDENGQIIEQQYGETAQNMYQYEPQYDEAGQVIQQHDYEDQSHLQYDENGQPIQLYDQQYADFGASESQEDPHGPKGDDKNTGYQNKVMDMLDTDTESLKQNTSKISNESDFDFGSG